MLDGVSCVANFLQSGAAKVSKNGFPFLLALILDSPILGLDFLCH